MKNIRVFLTENFQFLEVKFSIYLNRRVFVMVRKFKVAKDVKFRPAENECTDAQSDLIFLWAHTLEGTFSQIFSFCRLIWPYTFA